MLSLRSVILLGCIVLFGAVWSFEIRKIEPRIPDRSHHLRTAPPCIKLYDLLRAYSNKYNVPFGIAYGIAAKETAYRGPFHWSYNPKLVSPAAAYGAMQIQVPTANFIWKGKRKITKADLLNDLELNVETSMKLMAHLKKTYGSWEVALGCYNTGYPVVNGYANDIIRISKEI